MARPGQASAEIGGTVTILDIGRHDPQDPDLQDQGRAPGQGAAGRDQAQAPEQRRAGFVALGPASHVAVIDAKTFEILDYLLVGRRTSGRWHSHPGRRAVAATNGVSSDVSVIDVDSLKVIKSVKVGRYPWGVVVTPSNTLEVRDPELRLAHARPCTR